jgi:hypothetical protein
VDRYCSRSLTRMGVGMMSRPTPRTPAVAVCHAPLLSPRGSVNQCVGMGTLTLAVTVVLALQAAGC